MTVNLNSALTALLRWWWLLLVAPGMAGLMTYHAVRQTPPTFVSTTTLMVGDVLRSPKPGEDQFSVVQNLANGYAQMVQRQPILEATVRTLGLPYSWEVLRQRIVVVHPTGALTIEIRAMDGDPVVARDIAATLAEQIIATSPTKDRKQEADQRRKFIRDELSDLQAKIESARTELNKKQAALSQETNARGVLDRQDEIKGLELNLTSWRTSYSELLASLEGRGDPNTVSIIEPALVPAAPTGPRGMWSILLATIGGFLIVAGGILAHELLSGKIRTGDDFRSTLVEEPSEVVSYIPRMSSSAGPIAVLAAPTSLAADSYRLLAAQLRFGESDASCHVMMVTSATNREGKSTTAANLGAALALGGSSVLLVDLDLRKPSLHTLLDVPNLRGAAEMLRYHDYNPEHHVVRTRIPRLWLLPAGQPTDNPTELLSRSARPLILSAWSAADYIIIDGPPLLAAADATVLTGFVPDTLFVARFDQTSGRNVRLALDLLGRQPTRLRGVVLNGVPDAQSSLTGYRHLEQRSGPSRWPSFADFGRGQEPHARALPVAVANEPWLPKGSEL
jgi:capsular exopolysaccharide synthesis family protein